MPDRPLGPVLHIVGKEAIVQPHEGFVAKGATVVTTNNRIIGKLDNPIGRVDHPYQVIRLNKGVGEEIVGELVIAKLGGKSSKRRKKH